MDGASQHSLADTPLMSSSIILCAGHPPVRPESPPDFYFCGNSGKMDYCTVMILEGFIAHENKCNQKGIGWCAAGSCCQHPHLLGQPISRPLPAHFGRRAHRHPLGDATGQHAPKPAGTGERYEILRKTATGIRHRPERADSGFPSTEVGRTERLRLHHAANVADDFRDLQSGQILWFRQTFLALDGRRQRSLRLVRHRDRFADCPGRQQGQRHLDHHRQSYRYRADDPVAAFGRLPLR